MFDVAWLKLSLAHGAAALRTGERTQAGAVAPADDEE
jgi:hypothetical protein